MKSLGSFAIFCTLALWGNAQCDVDLIQQNIFCKGTCSGQTIATPTGMPPITYSWSNGETTAALDSLCPGTYVLTMTDDTGCVAIDSVTITEAADTFIVNANYIAGTSGVGWCDGELEWITTGGITPFSINWKECASMIPYTSLPGFCAGDYYCVITDANGCVDSSECVTVSSPVIGLDEDLGSTDFQIYPNPVKDILRVHCNAERLSGSATLILYDLSGQELQYWSLPTNTTDHSFNTSDLITGTYVIRVVDQGKSLFNTQFIKE
ncbi:T9SS type A sorting domain-containing protein [Crocinitomix catalasitica]|nr:T9SS type A sorting domain-containing protein [Crocinitomix catalasitica]